MPAYIGIDTSNYTSSVAVYNAATDEMFMNKKLLAVKQGEVGLRQSEAVFAHVKQLAEVAGALEVSGLDKQFGALGVSISPRDEAGSYMPCFLVGKMAAELLGHFLQLPVHYFSHQSGHVMAALYSAGQLSLLKQRFLAFHVSGGTTEALLIKPGKNTVFEVKGVAKSLDANAGQIIDRIGCMLGLSFPAGAALEELALQSHAQFYPKVAMKEENFCLSGLQNQCEKLFDETQNPFDTAKYCLLYIAQSLCSCAQILREKVGPMPILFAGGVMCNSIIRQYLSERLKGIYFCTEKEYSSDNAAGIALLAAYQRKESIFYGE